MTDNRKIAQLRAEINQLDVEKRQQAAAAQSGGMLVTVSSAGMLIGLLLLIASNRWVGLLVMAGSIGLFIYQWFRRRSALKRVAEITTQVERFEQEIAAEMGLASADRP